MAATSSPSRGLLLAVRSRAAAGVFALAGETVVAAAVLGSLVRGDDTGTGLVASGRLLRALDGRVGRASRSPFLLLVFGRTAGPCGCRYWRSALIGRAGARSSGAGAGIIRAPLGSRVGSSGHDLGSCSPCCSRASLGADTRVDGARALPRRGGSRLRRRCGSSPSVCRRLRARPDSRRRPCSASSLYAALLLVWRGRLGLRTRRGRYMRALHWRYRRMLRDAVKQALP